MPAMHQQVVTRQPEGIRRAEGTQQPAHTQHQQRQEAMVDIQRQLAPPPHRPRILVVVGIPPPLLRTQLHLATPPAEGATQLHQ